MSDISTDAMMREAAMMDASDNHVWARKTRRLCIERDKLQARLAEVEAERVMSKAAYDSVSSLLLSVQQDCIREHKRAEAAEARVKTLEEAQPAPEVAALVAAAKMFDAVCSNYATPTGAAVWAGHHYINAGNLRAAWEATRAALAAMEGRG